MNRETVSIIIPTRDRKDSLKEVLDSIGQFNYPKEQFEVIVVDDGSADGTGELVRKLQTQSPFKVQYYRQERKGLSAAVRTRLSVRLARHPRRGRAVERRAGLRAPRARLRPPEPALAGA